MNRLIWIDDSYTKMEPILKGAFYKLWEKNIFCQIVFWGDEFGEATDSEDDVFQRKLKDAFAMYRRTSEGSAKASDREQQDLIERVETQRCVSSIRVSDYQTHIEAWKTIEPSVWVPGADLKSIYTPSYLEALVEETGDEVVFALDLVLLEGDKVRLEKEDIPILSMELYHYIRHVLNKECVLLTAHAFGRNFPSKWKQVYRHRYTESADSAIGSREYFHRGTIKMRVLEEMESLFHREETL